MFLCAVCCVGGHGCGDMMCLLNVQMVMALYSERSIVTVAGSEYRGRDQICSQIRALGNHE
jgi:hypothetical protein